MRLSRRFACVVLALALALALAPTALAGKKSPSAPTPVFSPVPIVAPSPVGASMIDIEALK
jgi:hypothetical protein